MSLPNTAYARIKSAGYDLDILRADHGYIVHLTRNGQRLATKHAPRIGRLTIEQVREKCHTGAWRSDSRMLAVLETLARIATGLNELATHSVSEAA